MISSAHVLTTPSVFTMLVYLLVFVLLLLPFSRTMRTVRRFLPSPVNDYYQTSGLDPKIKLGAQDSKTNAPSVVQFTISKAVLNYFMW